MFYYLDGKKMMIGDKVLLDGKYRGEIELIVIPGTPIAKDLGYKEKPVFLIRTEDLGLLEEDTTDCDLILLSRKRAFEK